MQLYDMVAVKFNEMTGVQGVDLATVQLYICRFYLCKSMI